MMQTTTGYDAASIEYLPNFVSNSDLHMFYDQTIDGKGSAALSYVPFDVDGEPRDALNPDIGIDEYTLPANSIALISIDHPIAPLCNPNGSIDLTVFNLGTTPLDSFVVEGAVHHLSGSVSLLSPVPYFPSTPLMPSGFAQISALTFPTGFADGDTLFVRIQISELMNTLFLQIQLL